MLNNEYIEGYVYVDANGTKFYIDEGKYYDAETGVLTVPSALLSDGIKVSVKATADRMGYTEIIEASGGNVVCDTCMVVAPIEDMGFEVIGVNSAKAANYVPSMCGLDVVYPKQNSSLIQYMKKNQLVISEYPCGTLLWLSW
mgnify:CR=1 FL=1